MYNDISEECYGLATKISHWVATALQGLHIVLHEVSTSCDTQIDASDMFYLTIAAPSWAQSRPHEVKVLTKWWGSYRIEISQIWFPQSCFSRNDVLTESLLTEWTLHFCVDHQPSQSSVSAKLSPYSILGTQSQDQHPHEEQFPNERSWGIQQSSKACEHVNVDQPRFSSFFKIGDKLDSFCDPIRDLKVFRDGYCKEKSGPYGLF